MLVWVFGDYTHVAQELQTDRLASKKQRNGAIDKEKEEEWCA